MRCLSQRVKSDGSVFPCGKCGPCLQRQRSGWTLRLEEELKVSSSAYFVTLTYSDECIPLTSSGFPTVSKRDCQLFLKRLRKAVSLIDKDIRIRFYLVAEYGSRTLRPHYHAIIFNLPVLSNNAAQNMIIESWKQGLVHVGSCTPASIGYCTKYCINRHYLPPHGGDKTFTLMSRRPGLGSSYVEANHDYHMADIRPYSVRPGGYKVSLPRFLNDKFYTESDKSFLRDQGIRSTLKSQRDSISSFFRLNPDCDALHYYSYQFTLDEKINSSIIDKSLNLDKL